MVKENEMLQTEIGLLPEDWVISIIQNISHRIGDGIHSTPTYEESGDYFFVNGNNLKNGKVFVDDNTKTVSLEQFKIHKRDLSNRTILLSINGTIGNIAFFNGESIILGKSACYINLKKTVNKDFIYFLLQSNRVQKYFEENLTGSTIKNLGLGTISNTKIPIPPLPEQEAIASALSDADAWIESLEQLIDKKRLVKQGAMQELLTPKEDWEVKKLGEIASIIIGLTYSPNDVRDFGTLVLRSSNIQNNKLAFENNVFVDMDLSERVIVKENDLLVCVRNGSKNLIGKCALIDKKTEGQAFGAFMSIIRSEFGKYLYHYFQTYHIQTQIEENLGATINQLTNATLKSFDISIPKSLSEQTRIATILSDMDVELEALATQLEKAKKIKRGMMQELLTGRIRLV